MVMQAEGGAKQEDFEEVPLFGDQPFIGDFDEERAKVLTILMDPESECPITTTRVASALYLSHYLKNKGYVFESLESLYQTLYELATSQEFESLSDSPPPLLSSESVDEDEKLNSSISKYSLTNEDLPNILSNLSISSTNEHFQDIEFIENGGFGKVYKAKSKMDDQIYAIKKTIFPDTIYDEKFNKLNCEMYYLSRLEHPNIIRYFGAWCEEYEVVYDMSNCFDTKCDSQKNLLDDDYSNSNHNNSDKNDESCSSNNKIKNSKDIETKVNKFICIKLKFCPQSLQNWLLEQNKTANFNFDFKTIQIVPKFLNDLMQGLNYIHSKFIIHRDIKPGNLLLSRDSLNEQILIICDFGLATSNQNNSDDTNDNINSEFNDSSNELAVAHTKRAGTRIYISPEQFNSCYYSYSSDMYSAGIVLYELIYPINTSSELVELVEAAKNGQMYHDINPHFSREAELVKLLLQNNPNDRPTANEILKMDIFQKPN